MNVSFWDKARMAEKIDLNLFIYAIKAFIAK